jgi:hypothetical protein
VAWSFDRGSGHRLKPSNRTVSWCRTMRQTGPRRMPFTCGRGLRIAGVQQSRSRTPAGAWWRSRKTPAIPSSFLTGAIALPSAISDCGRIRAAPLQPRACSRLRPDRKEGSYLRWQAEELRTEAGRSMDTVAQKPYCKLDVSATLQANMEPSL